MVMLNLWHMDSRGDPFYMAKVYVFVRLGRRFTEVLSSQVRIDRIRIRFKWSECLVSCVRVW